MCSAAVGDRSFPLIAVEGVLMTYHGPKVRLARQVGIAWTPKAAKVLQTRAYPPGEHGRGRKKESAYRVQLLEKQKLRYQYHIGEKQLINAFVKAQKSSENTVDVLMGLLECRLDMMVLRGNLARTIYQARQVVVHGHVRVNGRRVDKPSYQMRPGDFLDICPKSREISLFRYSEGLTVPPPYVEIDPANFSLKLLRVPVRDDVPVIADLPAIIEFYSR